MLTIRFFPARVGFVAFALAFVGALWVAGAPAAAADEPTYLAEYKRYNAALEAGDRAAAIVYAKAAWEAAETALGDDRLTAILAFNYANAVVLRDPPSALAPARRASALNSVAGDAINAEELALIIAYGEYFDDKQRARQSKAVLEAIDAVRSEFGSDPQIATMQVNLALSEIDNNRARTARDAAAGAISDLRKIGVTEGAIYAQALTFHAVALTTPTRRTNADLVQAHQDLTVALSLYPPQASVDTFDPFLGVILGWRSVVVGLAISRNIDAEEFASAEDLGVAAPELFEHHIGGPFECQIEWRKRQFPEYPERLLRDGYIGAVLAVYDVDGPGAIKNPRVLAEVPAKLFTDAVEKVMQDWEVASIPIDHPKCRKDTVTTVYFIVEDVY